MMKKTKLIALFELALIITMSVSFSYMLSQTNQDTQIVSNAWIESEAISKMRSAFLSWMSHGLVSAQSINTCLLDVNGSYCQEYLAGECNSVCTESCFPGAREDYEPCKLGTCQDSSQGTCSPNTPKSLCEDNGGQWYEDAPAQCNKGCCTIGSQSQFITEQTCTVLSQQQGIEQQWQPAANELQCISIAASQEEGACVLGLSDDGINNDCKFSTKASCISLGGEFHSGFLCSAVELNTVCEKQASTSCLEGKDEVYWLDSCGNRENIYDSNKDKSWNSGKVLSKAASCSVFSGDNPVGNQKTCGNCQYLAGSICGKATVGDLKPLNGDYVCKDLSCTDEKGKKKSNGESWCEYDGWIGVDGSGNEGRSTNVAGSGSYRKVCFEGQVSSDNCADFRNEICVQSNTAGFSSAACRLNTWQLCLNSNDDEKSLQSCQENQDCFLKSVEVGENYKFAVCVPKYPPGFDLSEDRGAVAGNQVCSIASQKCTSIWVKKLSGLSVKWKCEANCECLEEEFTETMNNLCMSLGDCGVKANVAGKVTDRGYSVREAPQLSDSYKDALKKYAQNKEGQKADPGNLAETLAKLGIPPGQQAQLADSGNILTIFGAVTGIAGIGLVFLGSTESGAGVLATLGAATTGGEVAAATSAPAGGVAAVESGAVAPSLSAAGGAIAGALIGAAAAALAIKFLGLEPGLDDWVEYALIGGAALGGGLIGAYAFAQAGTFFAAAVIPIVGLAIVAVVAALIIYFYVAGVGKTKEITVEFNCLPWQPPLGGADCEQCGKDGLPCTKYKCQSLGQTCKLVNEGTGEEICVNTSPNDASPPQISPDSNALGSNLSYTSSGNNGVKIISTVTEDGCIKEYSPINFGIALNEPGQCKIAYEHTSNYNAMSEYMGKSNIFKYNHAHVFALPGLDSLGVSGVDPSRRGEFNAYIRCQDGTGNTHVQEYAVNVCVRPADDLTPPIINEFMPPSPGYGGFNATQKMITFYTNEPSECRFDTEDKSYELMSNATLCYNGLNEVTFKGWLCSANLQVPEGESDTKYYFRCKDQPWLSQNDDETDDVNRNVNSESTIYTVKKSISPLTISSISPNEQTIFTGYIPTSVTLEIKTSGGANGNAVCEYSFWGETYINFFSTGGSTHKQVFSSMLSGDYDIKLRCKDVAGNAVEGSSVFNIEVDSNPPAITSIYQQPVGTLNVITNEQAICRLSTESCSFNFEEGEQMSGVGLVHISPIENGISYYLKCKDNYGNVGSCLAAMGGYNA